MHCVKALNCKTTFCAWFHRVRQRFVIELLGQKLLCYAFLFASKCAYLQDPDVRKHVHCVNALGCKTTVFACFFHDFIMSALWAARSRCLDAFHCVIAFVVTLWLFTVSMLFSSSQPKVRVAAPALSKRPRSYYAQGSMSVGPGCTHGAKPSWIVFLSGGNGPYHRENAISNCQLQLEFMLKNIPLMMSITIKYPYPYHQ